MNQRNVISIVLLVLVVIIIIGVVSALSYMPVGAPAPEVTTETNANPVTNVSGVTLTKSPIVGDWVWQYSLSKSGSKTEIPKAEFTASFLADGTFLSTTDCNSLGGKFFVTNEILTIGTIAATKKACPPPTLEDEYTDQIGRAASFTIAGNELRINLLKDTGTMIFIRKVAVVPPKTTSTQPTALSLNNTTFRLSSFNGTVLPLSQNYFVSFESGTVNAKFCNGMGGSYTLTGNKLTANLMGTLMYCSSPDNIMTIESTFGSILGTGATILQEGTTMTLTGTKGEKMVFTVAPKQN